MGMGPYAYKNAEWVSFDDIDTIEEKMALLRKWNLGGAMVWALDLDDFNNQCGGGSYPLLKTINKGLGRLKNFKRPELLTTNLNRISTQLEDESGVEQVNQSGIVSLPYQLYWTNQPTSSYRVPASTKVLAPVVPLVNYNPKK